MTPENFCYWLQGLLEIGQPIKLDEQQVQIIKDHLALVFKKETPDRTSNIISDFYKNKSKTHDRRLCCSHPAQIDPPPSNVRSSLYDSQLMVDFQGLPQASC
jgi:hypothetical protein